MDLVSLGSPLPEWKKCNFFSECLTLTRPQDPLLGVSPLHRDFSSWGGGDREAWGDSQNADSFGLIGKFRYQNWGWTVHTVGCLFVPFWLPQVNSEDRGQRSGCATPFQSLWSQPGSPKAVFPSRSLPAVMSVLCSCGSAVCGGTLVRRSLPTHEVIKSRW